MGNEKLTLVEAVETLSHIADMNIDPAIQIFQDEGILVTPNDTLRDVIWQSQEGLDTVKNIFSAVLGYLRRFYKDEYAAISDRKTLEGIKAIMVLVGEAAKKIDKIQSEHFRGKFESVTQTREYKQLQEFYKRNISQTVDEGMLGKWLLALTRSAMKHTHKSEKKMIAEHAFIDLDAIKKDTDYELLLIRKEDGSRFFDPRIIRNIKLISEFGHFISKGRRDGRDIGLSELRDRIAFHMADTIYSEIKPHINEFYRHIKLYEEAADVAAELNKCFIALMLACDRDLLEKPGKKRIVEYLTNATDFLKKAVNDREFQKMLLYGAKGEHSSALLNIIKITLKSFYEPSFDIKMVDPYIKQICHEESSLSKCSEMLEKLIKQDEGPLAKALQLFEEGSGNYFEPLSGINLPTHPYNIKIGKKTAALYRLPSPIVQEEIDKAILSPGFHAAVNGKVLILNWQDKHSWKGGARAKAIESLNVPEISWPIESDFYKQTGSFSKISQAEAFKAELLSYINRLNLHFRFSSSKWITKIHKNVFNLKSSLSVEERQMFIDMINVIIEISAIEHYAPDKVYFICKDGLDMCPVQMMMLAAFANCENNSHYTLQGLPLLTRGRPLLLSLAKRCEQFISLCRDGDWGSSFYPTACVSRA